MERVLVSRELEDIVDKDNILGEKNQKKIPVTILFDSSRIYTDLEKIQKFKENFEICFLVPAEDFLKILFSIDSTKIIINRSKSFNFLGFKSASFETGQDMYLCKIIINNLE